MWSCEAQKKRRSKLLQWILQNILENQTFQRKAEFIIGDFYEMDFTKAIVILVKIDEMYNILKSANYCLLHERWKWNWIVKVFAGICPWTSVRLLLCSSFIKGQDSSLKRNSSRERVWYCNVDDTGARSFGNPRKQKWTKKVTFNKDL